MEGQEIILKLEHVVKRFGGIAASNDINIDVPRGSIYGIICPNGGGKTTLFNMITGVYHVIANKGIARTFQNIRLFGDLSVYSNLLTACQKNITYSLLDGVLRTRKCRSQELEMEAFCMELLDEAGLADVKDQKASNLPYGMQRRLEIARALATRPKLILLDEPAAGMNEEESDRLSRFIRGIRDRKKITVVIIDHHMDVIMAICDQITVLNFGTLLAAGSPDEIQSNPEVISAYLGVDE